MSFYKEHIISDLYICVFMFNFEIDENLDKKSMDYEFPQNKKKCGLTAFWDAGAALQGCIKLS